VLCGLKPLEQLGVHRRPGDQLPGSRKKGVTVCGVPRSWVAAGLGLLGALLLQRGRALLTFAWSLLLGKHDDVQFLPEVLFVPNLCPSASHGLLVIASWWAPAGVSLVALHATFRSPNLKARLGSAREEFRCRQSSCGTNAASVACWASTVLLR
jgi:hypothetical protein